MNSFSFFDKSLTSLLSLLCWHDGSVPFAVIWCLEAFGSQFIVWTVSPAYVRFDICYWGLRSMCYCLSSRLLRWSVRTESYGFTDRLAGLVSKASAFLVVVNAGLMRVYRNCVNVNTSC
jgi:hypothetical protein